MGNEWKPYVLDDLIEMQTAKVDSGLINIENYISTENMLPNKGGVKQAAGLPEQEKYLEFKKGDVLFSNIRTYFRKVWQAPFDGGASNDLIVFRARNTDILDQSFLYSLLADERFIEFTVTTAKGTKMPRGDKSAMKTYELSLPTDINEQKAIAHILGRLDDKIELNRQMNQTLEAMAQALFKSWFVDFDPVLDNALAAGNPIPEELQARVKTRNLASQTHTKPLPKAIQKLFPNEFEFSDEMDRWIPRGWKDTDMTKCLDTISKTYKLKDIDEIIFLNTGDIEDGRFLHSNYSKTEGLPGQAKKSIQEGDILYSEIRPKNKRFAYVYFDSTDYVVSTKLMVLRPKNEIDPLFYYQILKSESTLTELQFLAESRSGTFPQITYDTLKAIKFVLTDHEGIMNHYTKVLKANFERSIENQKQTEILTQLRDTLLPKLISGELIVPELEKIMEA